MRLTVEEHRQAVRRYGHIKPARSRAGRCRAGCPGTARKCTLAMGHTGPHVAHGWFRRVVAVWDSGAKAHSSRSPKTSASEDMAPSRSPRRQPIGLPADRPQGVLKPIWKRVLEVVPSVDTLVFLVLFLGFVGFAVQWFLLMFGIG